MVKQATRRGFLLYLAADTELPYDFGYERVLMIALPFDITKLTELCRQNDVAKLSIFGSIARGEADKQSDIDLLVEFSKRKSLLALVALERKFSTVLGQKVHLLTEAAISPYLRDRVKRDLQIIYEAG